MTQAQLSRPNRRSFVFAALDTAGAEWRTLGDALVATRVGGERTDAAVVLRDLSPLPRTGFKGGDTPDWLVARGVTIPSVHNQAVIQADGTLAARLSPGEFLLLSDPKGATGLVETLDAQWSIDTAGLCFQVPRRDSHAWFLLSGSRTPDLFAKICGVDLRTHKFADGAIAQTSVARLSAIVIRDDRAGDPAYHLLADSASAAYLWAALLDAAREFNGSVAGLDSLFVKA
jgi:sarcosine oxidase subunit gamma